MARRRVLCLLGHHWTYVIAPPTVAGWCIRCNTAAPVGAQSPKAVAQSDTADAASTYQLLADAIAGRPVEPSRADTATLIKAACLLIFMLRPAEPAAVLRIVRERLEVAEDVAAVRHLFDAEGRPR
jgi:hypothetical protein